MSLPITYIATTFVFVCAFASAQASSRSQVSKPSATPTSTASSISPEVSSDQPQVSPLGESNTPNPTPAPEPSPSPTPSPTPAPEAKRKPLIPSIPTAELREASKFTVSYTASPMGIPVPFKHGPSVAWIIDRNWTVEGSYFTGSFGVSTEFLDIGSFTETLITLNARYYPGNSFNWLIGVSRQSYEAHIGSALVSRLSGGNIPGDIDLVKVATIGLQTGLGNRWQWKNGLTLGIDWIVINIPFMTSRSEAAFLDYVSNQDDRRHVEDALKVMRFLPTGPITKISVGYSF